MKITFVLPPVVWVPGGSHRVVYEHANQLAERGHQVTLVVPRRVPWLGRLTLRGRITDIRRSLVGPQPRWFTLDPRVRCIAVPDPSARYIPPGDVVVATQWFIAEAMASYRPECGTQFALIHHPEAASGAPAARVEATWRMPCVKIAVSRWTAEQVRMHGTGPVEHVPNGIDHSLYRLTQPISARPCRIALAYVDKVVKDMPTALRALELVRAQLPELRADLFGAGPAPSPLPSWMTYHRRQSNTFLVEQIYNRSALFLCSSRVEGFGLAAAEAMACGCALVSTDCGGIREFAEHGTTALLAPPGDPSTLAKHMGELLAHPAQRVALAEAGTRRVAEFTWERSAAACEQVLLNALTPNPLSRARESGQGVRAYADPETLHTERPLC